MDLSKLLALPRSPAPESSRAPDVGRAFGGGKALGAGRAQLRLLRTGPSSVRCRGFADGSARGRRELAAGERGAGCCMQAVSAHLFSL